MVYQKRLGLCWTTLLHHTIDRSGHRDQKKRKTLEVNGIPELEMIPWTPLLNRRIVEVGVKVVEVREAGNLTVQLLDTDDEQLQALCRSGF